ncbi:Interactor of constitutive active ROPs 2 [Nymphaea thermarum]|nr:Interactor of constitutive active ROPs 2 [Nymphaea thermarum]
MQAPKTRNSPSEIAQKSSMTTPRVARQLKMAGDADSTPSSNSTTRTPTERSPKVSPKVTERRSPRSPMTEKKRPTRAAEMESQIAQLQEDLKKAKEQLSNSESSKKKVLLEAEETKKQLAAVTAKLDDSQHQLIELSATEESRVLELCKISQEKDRAWQSELKAVQNKHSVDSAALAAANVEIQQLKHEITLAAEQSRLAEDAQAEIHTLKQDLFQARSLVDDLNDQLKVCRDSEAHANSLANETLVNLVSANLTIESLKSEAHKYKESHESLSLQLQESQAKVILLEKHVHNLQCDLVEVGDKPLFNLECQLKLELDAAKQEVEQLRCAVEETEAKLHEAVIESVMKIQNAHEALEIMKAESDMCMNKEAEMLSTLRTAETKLEKFQLEVSDLKANMMDKETELQSIVEENECLKADKQKREQEQQIADFANALADVEAAKAREQQALLKLEAVTTESEKINRRATWLAEQLEVAQASNSAMEAELKRLRVQTEQWKKAADAAAAVLATAHNGKTVERTGSMDSSVYSNIRVGSPFYEDMDENSPRKKNAMLKKFGDLWKKKSQHK